ncbi:GATA transcription factor 4 [Elaeis guineensis]|uniref:GATA transcription factor 4 n=1 Tax=Elaeis guineensis var. tenera TaxID=51953 RepID=A0A6I9RWV4_ELAGV|nr:GATA transcription factor 4 [Elaeis guineensis]
MAAEWEIGMGMDFGMGMGPGASAAAAPLTATAAPAYLYGLPSADTLRIDDLLDFSNHDHFPSMEAHLLPPPEPSSAVTATTRPPFSGETDSSSDFQPHHHPSSFPDDLYIPSEEAAELEWLSKFVEDSFSDIPYPPAATGVATPAGGAHLRAEPSVPGRGARSKRSRAPTGSAAAVAWSSLQPPSQSSPSSSSSSSDFPQSKPKASAGDNSNNGRGKKGGGEIVEGGVRRCTHCASEKTPQWRTGPLGPKTLCNACGVRYKSGRLVPEYRPAASPTFVLTQHSNSHRKVMELRRQKEILLRHENPTSPSSASAAAVSVTAATAPRPELLFHDYGVC